MNIWAIVRGALGVVTVVAIVLGAWQVREYLDGVRSGYERWFYAPFLLAAVTGIIVLGPRRNYRYKARPDQTALDTVATQPTRANPWAIGWFVALCLIGGVAQLVAFVGST